MKDLEDLTLKILKSSGKFTSNDFIKAYNIIYLHCTEKTQTYEIKGRVIYELLENVLRNYFKSLRPISSLRMFYDLNRKLEKSFILLERVYFYIERFFINVNSKKRGSNVVHLRTLFYDRLYKDFMYACMTDLEEYFIYEIDQTRESAPTNELCDSISFLKDLFFYSENEVEYEHFLEMYFNSFNLILEGDDIISMIKKVNYELKLSKLLFEFSSKESYFEITKNIAKNFKKFLEWFFRSKKSKFLKNYKKIEQILYYMDDKYVDQFFSKFEPFIMSHLEKLEDLNDIFMFFIEFKDTFNLGNVKTDTLEIKIEKEIIAKIRNKENVPEFFSDLIDKHIFNNMNNINNINSDNDMNIINEDIINRDNDMNNINSDNDMNIINEDIINRDNDMNIINRDNIIKYIFYLTNLIYQKNQILKKMGQDCLQRIINDTTHLDLELKINKICETFCGSSSVSWLKHILQTYNTPLMQKFGLGGQDFDFEIDFRLITKGFCNLDISTTILHPKLEDLKDILIKRSLLKYPRSDIKCCYRASFMIIEFNGFDIRLSTDKVSILMFLSDHSDLEMIKLKCKDPNFEENIEFLEKNGILKIEGTNAFFNENFNNLNINTTNNSNIKKDLIDLFSYEIQAKTKLEVNFESEGLLESAIECFIMKIMKRLKKSNLEIVLLELERSFKSKNINFKSFLDKLSSKGYISISNGEVNYIP